MKQRPGWRLGVGAKLETGATLKSAGQLFGNRSRQGRLTTTLSESSQKNKLRCRCRCMAVWTCMNALWKRYEVLPMQKRGMPMQCARMCNTVSIYLTRWFIINVQHLNSPLYIQHECVGRMNVDCGVNGQFGLTWVCAWKYPKICHLEL